MKRKADQTQPGCTPTETFQHFISVFRDPPDADSLMRQVSAKTTQLITKGPEEGEEEEDSNDDNDKRRKSSFRGLQYSADGSNQKFILLAASFLFGRLQECVLGCTGTSIPNLGKNGKEFKRFALELGKAEPELAAVTGTLLYSLFRHMCDESLALERFLSTASGIQWQDTHLSKTSSSLRDLEDQLHQAKQQQEQQKMDQIKEVEEASRDVISASMGNRPRAALSKDRSSGDLGSSDAVSFRSTSTELSHTVPARSHRSRHGHSSDPILEHFKAQQSKLQDSMSRIQQSASIDITKVTQQVTSLHTEMSHFMRMIIAHLEQLGGSVNAQARQIKAMSDTINNIETNLEKLDVISSATRTLSKDIKTLKDNAQEYPDTRVISMSAVPMAPHMTMPSVNNSSSSSHPYRYY
ncbi:hypothetical protein B0O80DRAFT_492417 [Mortierella sp. GBAus27b]|nr:hypothetical protein BGX31_002251 [Mortierella sp. GBA43]KAI8363269.1 hypothetical protein B0O80DRAFT_492417 [Mortierella sp. GBAus27b]